MDVNDDTGSLTPRSALRLVVSTPPGPSSRLPTTNQTAQFHSPPFKRTPLLADNLSGRSDPLFAASLAITVPNEIP